MKKYDQYAAADKIDAHLHDNDVHYLTGEIDNDNVTEAIKWILSANLQRKPKKTLKLYINTVGGDLYESFALIDTMKNSYHHISTIGIGAGQQNRLDSCRIATQKARKFQPKNLTNSIAASDAFFPFADGIKTLINAGVKIIVQPGGSIRDKEVINAANKAKIKMVFTGIRHFNH